jgi:hypothetical protein
MQEKKPPLNTPEYTAYVNKLMIDLYEKSQKNKENEKIYYPVAYCEREIAKKFKGRWDAENKGWYFPNEDCLNGFVDYEG